MELLYVLKNKNKYEREERERQRQELEELRADGVFRVALNKDIAILRTILSDSSVSSVDIEVAEEYLPSFHKALYYEEMKEFTWLQGKHPTVFRFKRKEIVL